MLYLIERPLSLDELLVIYQPTVLQNTRPKRAGRRPTSALDGVKFLLDPLTQAYQYRDTDNVISLTNAIIGLFFDAAEFESARMYAEQLLRVVRELNNGNQIARTLAHLATIEFQNGNAEVAYTNLMQALDVLQNVEQRTLYGYLAISAASVMCYSGGYQQASTQFDEAAEIFNRSTNELGQAWWRHVYARDFLRDGGDYDQAIRLLTGAVDSLHQRASPQAVIENLLATADCWLQLGRIDRAGEVVGHVEPLIAVGKRRWYVPELALLKGRIALAQGNLTKATGFFEVGIGGVSSGGDMKELAPLYTALGVLLESSGERQEDARDALERAVNCSRHQARKLHLAVALQTCGNFLKRFTNRPTERARGSGYLFEGHQIMTQMGIPRPAQQGG
jgi:tetratricopeptide (TPR) repeat protein